MQYILAFNLFRLSQLMHMPQVVQLPECSEPTMKRHERELNVKLFDGKNCRYTLSNVVRLLNKLSGHEHAPHNDIKPRYAL